MRLAPIIHSEKFKQRKKNCLYSEKINPSYSYKRFIEVAINNLTVSRKSWEGRKETGRQPLEKTSTSLDTQH